MLTIPVRSSVKILPSDENVEPISPLLKKMSFMRINIRDFLLIAVCCCLLSFPCKDCPTSSCYLFPFFIAIRQR